MIKIDHFKKTEIFSKTIDVVPFKETGETLLENGENLFPFTMTLPQKLPSSYHTVLNGCDAQGDFGKQHGENWLS